MCWWRPLSSRIPTIAGAKSGDVTIKIDAAVTLEDSGNPNYSQVAVPFSLKCPASMTGIQYLYAFVSQPNAPSSFGFVSPVRCTGNTEKYTAHVQSNFGTLYVPGPATATITNFAVGNTREVEIQAS